MQNVPLSAGLMTASRTWEQIDKVKSDLKTQGWMHIKLYQSPQRLPIISGGGYACPIILNKCSIMGWYLQEKSLFQTSIIGAIKQ